MDEKQIKHLVSMLTDKQKRQILQLSAAIVGERALCPGALDPAVVAAALPLG